jgi:hypothetical protein
MNKPNVPTPIATFPIERIFANGNSIPITKSSNITPISANTFNAAISDKIPIPPAPTLFPFSDRNDAHKGSL